MNALLLDGQPLTLAEVESVARGGRSVMLGDIARKSILASRTIVDDHCRGNEPLYGINTGFGSLSRVRIEPDQVREVQRNLIRSHAAVLQNDLGVLLDADDVFTCATRKHGGVFVFEPNVVDSREHPGHLLGPVERVGRVELGGALNK
jgi:hypothetical protein